MSKDKLRNPLEQQQEKTTSPITEVVEEIKEQDLAEKVIGGDANAIVLTFRGECGKVFTYSYECSLPRKRCWDFEKNICLRKDTVYSELYKHCKRRENTFENGAVLLSRSRQFHFLCSGHFYS